MSSVWISKPPEPLGNLLEDEGVVDGGGSRVGNPVRDTLHRAPKEFPRARLGQSLHHGGRLESRHWPNGVAYALDQLLHDLVLTALDTGLGHHEAQGNLPFQLIGDADHRALGHVRMGG